MKARHLVYWGITAALVVAGLCMSIVERDGHYAFHWNGAELMAQPKLDEFHDLASLQILNRVLLQLQQYYVDPSRLDPELMIASGLDRLQKSVPELLLRFDRHVKDRPTKVTAIIGGRSKDFSLAGLGNLWEMSLRLRGILAFIQEGLPSDAKLRDLEYAVINGMLEVLDPHSLVLSPEVYRSMVEGNRGKFGGLGIVIRMVDGVLVIVEKVEGDVPAKKAGLEEGDQILEIDGTPTLNMDINEAVDLLKGEPDTKVSLLVMRKGWKEARRFEVTRAEIAISSIEAESFDGIAYIRIKGFQGNTQSDLLSALERIQKEAGDIKGLILDLRGNPGGLLEQAVSVADDFLESGTIVTTGGSDESMQKTRQAKAEATQPPYPMIVMLDSSSASASEIVAGALKNNDRALVIGDTSFGKGSIQVLYELPDKSSLKLTIGQYLTPGNLSIQSVGIVPDIRFVPMHVAKDAIDIYPVSWTRREESLGSHLVNQNAHRDAVPSYNLRYVSRRYSSEKLDEASLLTLEDVDRILKEREKTNRPADDPQVRLALSILRGNGDAHTRGAMIEKFLTGADALQAEEDAALVAEFAKRGIDWSDCARPDDISLALHLETDREGNAVTAGDEFRLRATATNRGTAPVCRISARTEASFTRLHDLEFIFGRIEPGQSVTRELPVRTNRALPASVDDVVATLYQDDGSPIPRIALATDTMPFTVNAIPQPAFRIHYVVTDGNGNGLLDDDEDVTVRLWVSNDGTGTASKPLFFFKNTAPQVRLVDARAETESLAPGDKIYRDFRFHTKDVGAENVQVELHVYDKSSTQSLVEKIGFPTAESEDVAGITGHPAKGTFRVAGAVPLRVAPVDRANSLTQIPPGTTVSRDTEFGAYSHVRAGELAGWLETTALEPSSDKPDSLTPSTMATIPRIVIGDVPHRSSENTVTLQAHISGFVDLLDCYALVSSEVDHIFRYSKVAYQTLSGREADVRMEIPLTKGQNIVRLVVRDRNKSEAHENYYVFRE